MPPLCSRISLVGQVPKGRWGLSWTNRRYGRNLGSLLRTKLETPIKWMEASSFFSSKESAPYTMCCEGDVHYGVWFWWGTAPSCISKADGKHCLLLNVSAAPSSPSVQEKTTPLGDTEPYHSSWQCKESHRCFLSRTSFAPGNGRFWNIHKLTRYESMQFSISSPKWNCQWRPVIRNLGSCIFSMTIIDSTKSVLPNLHHSFWFSLLFLNTNV